jgi:hypothetical protein
LTDVIDEVLDFLNSDTRKKNKIEEWAINKILELQLSIDNEQEIENLTLLIKDITGIEEADNYNELGIESNAFKRKQRRKVRLLLKKEVSRTPTEVLRTDQVLKDSFKERGFKDKIFR